MILEINQHRCPKWGTRKVVFLLSLPFDVRALVQPSHVCFDDTNQPPQFAYSHDFQTKNQPPTRFLYLPFSALIALPCCILSTVDPRCCTNIKLELLSTVQPTSKLPLEPPLPRLTTIARQDPSLSPAIWE